MVLSYFFKTKVFKIISRILQCVLVVNLKISQLENFNVIRLNCHINTKFSSFILNSMLLVLLESRRSRSYFLSFHQYIRTELKNIDHIYIYNIYILKIATRQAKCLFDFHFYVSLKIIMELA